MSGSPLTEYGNSYCVIDVHNLFVGTTVEDELLLLGADEVDAQRLQEECAGFGLRVEPGRRLSTYSGGEQAMICCLLVLLLLPATPVRILLVHVLETLSARNREELLRRFAELQPQAAVFTLAETGPRAAHA